MRARNSVWRQPSDLDRGQSIQLTRKLAGYWVNSVEQEQVRCWRGRNRNIPSKDASLVLGAVPQKPASAEMQNLWPTLPALNDRGCGHSLADKSNRVQRLAGNRRERSLDHEQLHY